MTNRAPTPLGLYAMLDQHLQHVQSACEGSDFSWCAGRVSAWIAHFHTDAVVAATAVHLCADVYGPLQSLKTARSNCCNAKPIIFNTSHSSVQLLSESEVLPRDEADDCLLLLIWTSTRKLFL